LTAGALRRGSSRPKAGCVKAQLRRQKKIRRYRLVLCLQLFDLGRGDLEVLVVLLLFLCIRAGSDASEINARVRVETTHCGDTVIFFS
jgi:hypothetical protein